MKHYHLSPDRITQDYIRRYPDSKRTRSWAGRMVHIETENGVWRKNAHGYTHSGTPEAWILPFEEAQKQVDHCGPEKRAAFLLVEKENPPIKTDEACVTCKFWKRYDQSGNCLRYPPQNTSPGNSHFPGTSAHNWCGEYQQKPDAEARR